MASRDKVSDFDAKISAKMDLENSHFCTQGGPLTVEITSLGENKGLLRLGVWSNGI